MSTQRCSGRPARFSPYPRLRPSAIRMGKFMSGQFRLPRRVLRRRRATLRASYRNFFPAHTRWQLAGLRLAENA